MAQVDRSAYVTASITLPGSKRANEWTNDTSLTVNNGTVIVQVPPGGLAIVEIF